MTLRVANIPQFSCVPYKALEGLPFLQYEENQLSKNLTKLEAGLLDIALVPAVDVLVNPRLRYLPFGMACRAQSDSMVLYAKQALGAIERIHVYAQSRSSTALLQVLFQDCFGSMPEVVKHSCVSPVDFVEKNEAALCLHRLPNTLLTEFPTRVDVASWWQECTGRPSVFLLWALGVRTLQDPALPKFVKWLGRIAKVAEGISHDFSDSFGVSTTDATTFISNNRRYYLDQSLFRGLEEFIRRAQQKRMLSECLLRPATKTVFTSDLRDLKGVVCG